MSHNIKKRVSLFIVAIFILQSCGSPPTPPSWEKCEMTNSAETEKSLPETSNYLVVYLDTSVSMSGYIAEKEKPPFAVSPDNETVYSKTLLELRTMLSSLNPQPEILLRTVSVDLSEAVSDDLAISRAAFTRAGYNGQETNLAGAIRAFTEPAKPSDDKRIPRVHMLVTDGVQSSTRQNENTACENGSDWRCVKKQLKSFLNAGWRGSILGIRSEFQGTVFSELKKGKVSYDSEKNVDKFRPFYLYILSPVQADAENLTNRLKKRLGEIAQENKIAPEKLFREYPLMTNLSDKKLTVQTEVSQADAQFIEVSGDESDATKLTAKVSLKTETEGPKPFDVKVKLPWNAHALDMASTEELFKSVKWEIVKVPLPELDNHRYPEVEMTGQTVNTDGTVTIHLKTGWRNEVTTPDWRMYRLIGALDRSSIPNWVRDWSTKDDTLQANGHKTLNLESSLANLWEFSGTSDLAVAEVCLRVGNK